MLGFGESEDPLPERPQHTRYRVFAGPCQKCSCPGRKLLELGGSLTLICDECGQQQDTSLAVSELSEVTYIYWCNSSKFASDEVQLSGEDARALADLARQFGDSYEVPRWAVMVVAGRCSSSDLCINFRCPYLIKSQ